MPRKPQSAAAVDLRAYLVSIPADARRALTKLCRDIQVAAPRAEPGRSYGVPGFRLNGRPLVCFAAAKHHCSLYPMSAALIEDHANQLKGYETSKGTIRFPPGRSLPTRLVRTIVKARVAQLEQAGSARTKRSRGKSARVVARKSI